MAHQISKGSKDAAFTGTCMCGAVKYTSTSLPSNITACHCLTCRRLSGSAFLMFAGVPISDVTFSPPSSPMSAHRQTRYSNMAVRTHCTECGSPISMAYHFEEGIIGLTMGSVVEDSIRGEFPKMSKHIFVDEKMNVGGWEIPNDGLQRQAGFTKDFEAQMNAWKRDNDGK